MSKALLMRATESDGVFKLERSRFGETPNSSTSLAYAEGLKSLYSFLD
ncbi:hypothetical protein Gorai_008815 [Gossypium raimondii]|uniref:Uncharacterized protein n=1 Tax=Gossypium raimondii TaxID=29730 RepID=A0A7J8PRA8_GOSRA|nr:hypothetical protein [Gossypium raimondii]